MSDHGAKRMEGGLALNEWFVDQGYLVLEDKPTGVVPLEKVRVSWNKTRACGAAADITDASFLNVQGREPNGVHSAGRNTNACGTNLIEKLSALRDDRGRPMATQRLQAAQIYRAVKNVPPDLIVLFLTTCAGARSARSA